jgi:RNA polymerase primary sigma factor
MPSHLDDEREGKPVRRSRRGRGTSERSATGDSLNAYIREISGFQPLSTEREKELARAIQQGDVEALKELVEANLRFVVSYSKRYRGLGMSFLDLIHEGTLGLIEAAKRFDPDRNVRFISYAVWWVRQAIFHALSEHSRAFRLPQKLSGQVSKVDTMRERLKSELERDPTTAELAQKTSLTEAQVQNVLLVAGGDLSLSTAVGDDGKLELGDVLQQASVPSIEMQLMRSSFEQRVHKLVSGLDAKEQQVIRMRFGLDDEDPKTLQEIGEILGLSRERVRQIESKAKEKLRRNSASLRGELASPA